MLQQSSIFYSQKVLCYFDINSQKNLEKISSLKPFFTATLNFDIFY